MTLFRFIVHDFVMFVGLLVFFSLLFGDGDGEVCLYTLRLLQSMMAEEEVLLLLGSSLLDPGFQNRVGWLTSEEEPSLRLAAQQTLEGLQALQQVPQS